MKSVINALGMSGLLSSMGAHDNIGGMPIYHGEIDKMIERQAKFHEIYEVSDNPMTDWQTRPGRHPMESRSKYDGSGRRIH